MNFVPSHSLINLVCANCKNYLSHFPIYFNPKIGSICGRCPKPDEADTVRNEVYECVAHSQKFPCRYNSNGCTESLAPSKIPQHEKYCPYLKCECPTFSSTNCPWRGFTKDLSDHFEEKHPTFLLKNASFELDFINSYQENCLLPVGEDLFIVSRSSDFKSNNFSCTVSYVGTNQLANDYIYKIVLENEKKSHVHATTNKLNVKTDIDTKIIKDILNNPSSIIATIEILEVGDVTEKIKTEENENEEETAVDYELMKELECTVCFEYMLPPIYQCLTGHSICISCKDKVDKCPTCEAEFKNTQNFTLAQVINHLTYPCKNKRCKFTAKAKDIKKHETTCVFGPFKCPLQEYQGCEDDIIFAETYDHIMNKHYEHLLEMETVSLPFEYGKEKYDDDCFIIRYGFRLFQLHYKFENDEFSWAMQLIGPVEESEKYMFEIDVVDNSGKNRRAYFKSVCSPLCNSNFAFSDEKSYIFFNYDQIKSMITKDFTYIVRVFHE